MFSPVVLEVLEFFCDEVQFGGNLYLNESAEFRFAKYCVLLFGMYGYKRATLAPNYEGMLGDLSAKILLKGTLDAANAAFKKLNDGKGKVSYATPFIAVNEIVKLINCPTTAAGQLNRSCLSPMVNTQYFADSFIPQTLATLKTKICQNCQVWPNIFCNADKCYQLLPIDGYFPDEDDNSMIEYANSDGKYSRTRRGHFASKKKV